MQTLLSRLGSSSRHMARALWRNRRGNVLAIVAGGLVPMTMAVGFGIDYARAMKLQSQMNAAADAAALAAVTAPMMQSNGTSAQTAAQNVARNMFNGQVSTLTNVVYDQNNDLTVTVSTTGALNNGRQVVVKWRAQSRNIFAGLLGANTLAISGTASSQAIKAPYINFHLVMDVSPSMLLPTTTAGLTSILNATKTSSLPYGCAFACHAMQPHNDGIYVRDANARDIFLMANYYNSGQTGYNTYFSVNTSTGKVYDSGGTVSTSYVYCSSYVYQTNSCTKKSGTNLVSGYWADGYWLTHNYSDAYPGNSDIEVRIDAERLAAQQLIPYAASQASANGVTYNMQMYSFDWTHTGYSSPVKALTSSMQDVSTISTSSVPDLYAAQDYWYQNNCPTSSLCISDAATEYANMLTTMNSTIPTPGDGATAANPQQVMFLITDGMSDEFIGSSRWNREMNSTDLAQCTAIKNRGIKIAILYTKYLPESMTGDSWSQSAVAPYLNNVAPALKNCASTGSDGSPLFFQVTTDESIGDALVTLFALTVQQAHLIQ